MPTNSRNSSAISERQIINAIGSQHYQVHKQHFLLMLFTFPFLAILAIGFYFLNSGTILEHYSTTLILCVNSNLSCLQVKDIWIPNWLIFRASLLSTSMLIYFPMRWSFRAKHWRLWWTMYCLYGGISIMTVASMFAGWMYFVPHLYKPWASFFETIIIFAFLLQNVWKAYKHPVIERMYKIGIYLTGISGVLGAIGVAMGRLLSKHGKMETAMFLIFLGYLLVVPLTALDWNKKIWASNPWLLSKKHKGK